MWLERVVRAVDLDDHHLTKEDGAKKRQNDDAKVIDALILNVVLHLGWVLSTTLLQRWYGSILRIDRFN